MTSYIKKVLEEFDKEFDLLSEKNDYEIGTTSMYDFIRKGSASEVGYDLKAFLTKALKDYKAHLLAEVKEKIPKMLPAYTEKKFEFIDYEARAYNEALLEVTKVLNEI